MALGAEERAEASCERTQQRAVSIEVGCSGRFTSRSLLRLKNGRPRRGAGQQAARKEHAKGLCCYRLCCPPGKGCPFEVRWQRQASEGCQDQGNTLRPPRMCIQPTSTIYATCSLVLSPPSLSSMRSKTPSCAVLMVCRRRSRARATSRSGEHSSRSGLEAFTSLLRSSRSLSLKLISCS